MYTLREDVYMVFAGSVAGTEEAVYRFTINPLVAWVWIGGFTLVFGGVITLWPGGGPARRGPRREEEAGYHASFEPTAEPAMQKQEPVGSGSGT